MTVLVAAAVVLVAAIAAFGVLDIDLRADSTGIMTSMIGSSLSLLGMSVAAAIFLIEFLDSHAENDSIYDTVSEEFRTNMESCIWWIVCLTVIQLILLSLALVYNPGLDVNGNIIIVGLTWFFCWNCILMLQFDYDLVTVKKRMKHISRRKMFEFANAIDSKFGQNASCVCSKGLKSTDVLDDLFLGDDYKVNVHGSNLSELWAGIRSKSDDSCEVDPFKLFHTVEQIVEKIADIQDETVVTSEKGHSLLWSLKNPKMADASDGKWFFKRFMKFRCLRDYAVVAKLDERSFCSSDFKTDERMVVDCILFLAIILERDCAASLDYRNLSGISLDRNNMGYAKMFSASLRDSVIKDSCFNKAEMSKADFSNSRIIRSSFVASNMADAVFNGVMAVNIDMNHSCSERISLKDANVKGMNIEFTDCSGLVASGIIEYLEANSLTVLDSSLLSDLSLNWSTINGASMNNILVVNCRVSYLDAEGVSCRSSEFGGIRFINGYMKGIDCMYSRFNDITLDSTDLINMDFTSCSFGKVVVHGGLIRESFFNKVCMSDFSVNGSVLINLDVSGSISSMKLSDARLNGIRISTTVFENCGFDALVSSSDGDTSELIDVDFQKGDMTSSVFERIALTNVTFNEVSFRKICLRSSILRNVSFNKCNFIDCIICQDTRKENVSFKNCTGVTDEIGGDLYED